MKISHDYLFKDVAMAFPDEVLTLTQPELALRIDLASVRFVPAQERFHQLLPKRRWFPDLVADVHDRWGSQSEALAHLEIERDFRSHEVPRFRDYSHVLELATGLPVHTAVVYLHGGSPGLAWKEYRSTSLGCLLGSFRYRSLGLARASARDYLERPERLAWAFAIHMNPTGIGSRAQLAIECLHRILDDAELDEVRRFKLLNFVQTYVTLDQSSSPEYASLLRRAQHQEVREMMMTWADQMVEKGREQGLEKGREQGLEKGREQGLEKGREQGLEKMRNVVADLASQRFGRLPARTRQRLAAIKSLDKLAQLATDVWKVDSLEELRIT